MNAEVLLVLQAEIKAGQTGALRERMKELAAWVEKTEPKTLTYSWWSNNDGTNLHVFERYVDSAAAMAHLANIQAHLSAILAAVNVEALTIYGATSPDLVQAFAGFSPRVMNVRGGFERG